MLIHNVFQHILFIKVYFHMDSQSATPNPYTTPYMKHIPVALWPSMLSCEKMYKVKTFFSYSVRCFHQLQ